MTMRLSPRAFCSPGINLGALNLTATEHFERLYARAREPDTYSTGTQNMKRLSTRRAMRASLERLQVKSEAIAGIRHGIEDGIVEMSPVADRPEGSHDLNNGTWVRDPSDGSVRWLRFAG
ncbi:MAG: hypothetical protein JSR99_09970 [Proteobacteria bacterium]|nr:hypothetical protein [Pseudomonadota bacterium]